MKVTIRNYLYPITFSYNGWNVKLEKRFGLFKDITVEATFEPSDPLYNDKFFFKDDKEYMSLVDKYSATLHLPDKRFARFSANGNIVDRFFGENISATEKVIEKITFYMDSNLPVIKGLDIKDFVSFLINNEISKKTLSTMLLMRKFGKW